MDREAMTSALAAEAGAARPRRSRWRRSSRLLRMRLLLAAPITVMVSMGTFWLASLSPFDPLAAYLGSRFEKTSAAQRAALTEQLGLDDSWIAIWGRWVQDVVLHWDWGQSRSLARPVSDVLAERLPYTLLLAGTGLTIAIVLSLLLGVCSAWRPGSWTDRFATGLAYAMQGIPPFVVALVAISVFSIMLGMPAGGVSQGGADPTAASIARHLVLPAFVLGLSQVPWLLLNVRSSLISALGDDHVTAARGRGLPDRTVVWNHALPAALLPFVTVIGVRLPELVTGALLVETVFTWPGLASATVDAAIDGDFPLLAAVTALTCFAVLIGSALADSVYLFVDPRIDDI